jgi:drug/metabolite transporter (DMT)-like permease
MRLVFALPWLAAALFFIPLVVPDRVFYGCLAVGLPLEALAFFCYMKAIRIAPLSLCLPFLAFTPAFLMLTGLAILGERISNRGAMGILLIVAGSYVLNFSKIKVDMLEPFREIFRQQGSRLMLATAMLYSATSVIGKAAILHSNPYFFAVVYFLVFTLVIGLLAPFFEKQPSSWRSVPLFPGVLIGLFMALMIFSHMLAIAKIEVAYMISIKRTSMLFGVAYGIFWFKEERALQRLAGAAIMLVGVLLVGWAA